MESEPAQGLRACDGPWVADHRKGSLIAFDPKHVMEVSYMDRDE